MERFWLSKNYVWNNWTITIKKYIYCIDFLPYLVQNEQYLLEDNSFLISVNGEFSVDIYNPSKENIKLIELLVQQEGLFLRKI